MDTDSVECIELQFDRLVRVETLMRVYTEFWDSLVGRVRYEDALEGRDPVEGGMYQ